MPQIVDYGEVLARLTASGLVCHYHNSGAFGFAAGPALHAFGWLSRPDATIRPDVKAELVTIPGQHPDEIVERAIRLWRELSAGVLWLMPASHWAYEMEFGNRWLHDALREAGVDPSTLASRNNGSAIAFSPADDGPLRRFLGRLLTELEDSDFALALPGLSVACIVHHHGQLWWMTPDGGLAERIRGTGVR